ncbi:NAD(P)/FAD-dependent oxidoreductase [Metallosphaera tengchongensis]|uniref:NAD(P)/FAD-dependent oxidoreductase n=1 Tax=Metallosphaera tengchongensis TaxID=1532350 RepID=A0A6N0NWM4_9CREN|nr:FAD/NAD(P)-binding protein [Metallosphaera tengchongensis]QKR00039.1 NAD(P)/FAD-dependent oxidoreductase [Metallosphaera tengchongensis]
MDVIIGAGISGLVAATTRESVVLEEQHEVGGVYLVDEVSNIKIPGLPPFVEREKEILEIFPSAVIDELSLIVETVDDIHLKEKVCQRCLSLPSWLRPRKVLMIRNMSELFNSLKSKVKIIRGYPVKISGNVLFSNRAPLEFKTLVNTGSRQRLDRIIGINENLDSIGCLIVTFTADKGLHSWDVLEYGKSSTIFSHIFRLNLSDELDVYYVYSFYNKNKLPDVERVMQDLKRAGVVVRQNIYSMRAKYIQECILMGEKRKERPQYVRDCGRLGLWENLSLSDAIGSALEC